MHLLLMLMKHGNMMNLLRTHSGSQTQLWKRRTRASVRPLVQSLTVDNSPERNIRSTAQAAVHGHLFRGSKQPKCFSG